ncbi:MAG: hypothetical protein ACJ77Z_14285 [Thermoleophilaceae bacterium]
MTSAQADKRASFYARGGSKWNDVLTLLHPPYTAWHLSYVVLGALAAPRIEPIRLVAAVAAFFLAVGIAAHAFDELHDRPLKTGLSRRTLAIAGGVALAGATGIGVVGTVTVSLTLAPLVLVGAGICLAYNLELAGGRFHGGTWFALAWGAFPAWTSYWVNALSVAAPGILVALACAALSVAQRRLSTPARTLRRRTVAISGRQELTDGSHVELSRETVLGPLEGALRSASLGITVLALGLLAARIS